MKTDVVVVGAGIGGLSTAALLTKKGYKVVVLEASNELGGCAGKFDRSGYRFAAGATLGMGFEEGGVLFRLYQELNLPLPKLINVPIIMDVHMPDGTIRYFREAENWYKEIARQFPSDQENIIAFYEEVFRIGSLLNQLITQNPTFPPKNLIHLKQLLPLISNQSVKLLPYFTQSVADRLKKYQLLSNKRFITFLNGQLMDSVQTTIHQSSAIIGYAALQTFHRGAYYVYGGLATIAEDLGQFIQHHGGEIIKRSKVIGIQKKADLWHVLTKRKEIFTAKQLVLNNSIHNLHSLLAEDVKGKVNIEEDKEKIRQAWGAFSLYVGCRDFLHEKEPLFHQFIESYDQPLAEGNHFLFSISVQDDQLMTTKGKRSITISTHTEPSQWWVREHYETKKQTYSDKIISTISSHFPAFQSSIDVLLPGTPVTFKRFVHREDGKVGGYISTNKYSWLTSYSSYSGMDGLWLCGDTVFPGAGTLGTVLSGMNVAKQVMQQ
ncbi:phytoene desaturase family protein [Halalkalibacter nanhaiisediminis]|uniref:C-3',4' desaturase CrtD n=1 Tax=Halalkalibacter nanhaiisediminis TaxID=688079 RepID=A0A562QQ17_9BACI|nr:FAD-dependent oxidoreductase [Halalkalibacter nanhaiisediminis]TWI58166.1 C-3',4' desaturase CrtD [Halalkalibacter nanhaiisediminis]